MQKSQPFIFSEEFEQAMDEAVARAVARANALGLPKAYLDSYDELPRVEKMLEVSTSSGFNKGSTAQLDDGDIK